MFLIVSDVGDERIRLSGRPLVRGDEWRKRATFWDGGFLKARHARVRQDSLRLQGLRQRAHLRQYDLGKKSSVGLQVYIKVIYNGDI